jgi:hypothetical protein
VSLVAVIMSCVRLHPRDPVATMVRSLTAPVLAPMR